MRIAIQNPYFLLIDQRRNFDGYNYEFLRQFRPMLYLTGWRAKLTRGKMWKEALVRNGLKLEDYPLLFSQGELRRNADVLLCFNQGACRDVNQPPRSFPGLKIWHVMDFNFFPSECYAALQQGGVEAVMAYTALDRHCAFFRECYPGYIGRTIPVPFGFGKRFEPQAPFSGRLQKAAAMGAIHPLGQVAKAPALRAYVAYYRQFPYSQMWRATLRENEERLAPVLDSFLPKPPETSRPGDDPVVMLNRYAMYANDDSICHFPPARTYEGAAAGAAMVAPDHECFRELGFIDGENCILHRPMDMDDFQQKVSAKIAQPQELAELARRGCEMVRARYTHAAVAARLHEEIARRWTGRTRA